MLTLSRTILALQLAGVLLATGCELKSEPIAAPQSPNQFDAGKLTLAADSQPAQAATDATAIAQANDSQAVVPDAAAANGFIVHEWGTFTSMQTSAGATLEGMHHEDEALPGFVHGRDIAILQSKAMESLPEEVTQKMETPVLYFHSPSARQVEVRVDFPQGVISQWFPNATASLPPVGALTKIAGGSMTWQVQLDPKLDPALAPAVAADDIWAPSRKVAATMLSHGGEVERFIFYRGLGRFELPVRVVADIGNHVTIHNDGKEALPAVFLLLATPDGGQVVSLGALAAGSSLQTEVPNPQAGLQQLVVSASTALHGALQTVGLYDDEARAMVDTWSKSYFQTPGLRVLYVLPAAWTDKLLPLTVTPAPTAVVRVLVGRIEVLTPAREQNIVDAVKATFATANPNTLKVLGRFLEPQLRRAAQLVTEPKLQAHVQQLILWARGQK